MRRSWLNGTLMGLAIGLVLGGVSRGDILAEREFVGVNRSMIVTLGGVADEGGGDERASDRAGRDADGALREVALLEARSGRVLERVSVGGSGGGVGVDGALEVDLAGAFPVLWTTRSPRVLVAQEYVDGRPVGSGLILQPLTTPTARRNGLTGLIEEAVAGERFETLRALSQMSAERRAMLARDVHRDGESDDAGAEVMLSGYRLIPDRHAVLETTLGELVIRLRYDAAPNSSAWFASLVDGGFYDGTAFHRIVPRDRDGNPFIAQAGDPTWTGRGGAGMWIDFEASDLEHDFGVVSLARRSDDPNSNGAQFFVSLSRAGCARLDGRYVAFAEVVSGGDVLGLLLSTPVGPRDPNRAGSPEDRPLDPPVIERAVLRPAPPYPERPDRIRQDEATEVVR